MDYLIYGAGGHARVLWDLVKTLGSGHRIMQFIQDGDGPDTFQGIPCGPYAADAHPESHLVLGIGNGQVRRDLSLQTQHPYTSLIHPSAYLAADVEIGPGSVVLAGAVIQSGARIGAHCIINALTTVDHDAIVGDFVTTYPGVYIGAESHIGTGTMLQPNAVVLRGAQSKDWSNVAPGAILRSTD